MFYAEKQAKEFLGKEGFEILESFYVSKSEEIKEKFSCLKFPVVVKVSGKKIVHKNKLGGVKMNVKNSQEILEVFSKMKKIKGFEGVVIQKQVKGKEIFLGLKKTPEFGHAIAFGSGGTDVEKKKDIIFRICPIGAEEANEMIKETEIFSKLSSKEISEIKKNLLQLNLLSKKYPRISELDINPLIVKGNFAKIIDARILWN